MGNKRGLAQYSEVECLQKLIEGLSVRQRAATLNGDVDKWNKQQPISLCSTVRVSRRTCAMSKVALMFELLSTIYDSIDM